MLQRSSDKPVVDLRSAQRSRWLMAVCALSFALFCLNVVLGKARILFGLELPFLLPDVPEFLMLLLSALFFTLAALAREKSVGSRAAGDGGRPPSSRGGLGFTQKTHHTKRRVGKESVSTCGSRWGSRP